MCWERVNTNTSSIKRKIAIEIRMRSSGVTLATREVYIGSKKYLNKLLVGFGSVSFVVLSVEQENGNFRIRWFRVFFIAFFISIVRIVFVIIFDHIYDLSWPDQSPIGHSICGVGNCLMRGQNGAFFFIFANYLKSNKARKMCDLSGHKCGTSSTSP